MLSLASLYLQLLIGLLLAAVIAVLAWKAGALTRSGGWAALLTGGLIFGFGGIQWAILLLVFFISSSALSRAFSQRKEKLAENFAKGSRRDWGQVLANGGLGALLVVIFAFLPQHEWIWMAFAGAMAAVNADTWSTELGVLSSISPRLITNGQKVERGTSGGITLTGTLAALGGSTLVGLVAVIIQPGAKWFIQLTIISLAGLVGSLFDSLLGATIQAIYWCPSCNKETERHPLHSCSTETTHLRGWEWFNNDMVNFACSLMGAGVADIFWLLIH